MSNGVRCRIHDAETHATEAKMGKVSEHFVVQCVYCLHNELTAQHRRIEELTRQRDGLAAAIEIKSTLQVIE